jgi:CTD small phosphatase-like protein 2
VQALQFIQNNIRVVEADEIQDMVIQLPPPKDGQKTLVIFDMDETLIHCVDDIETDDPDVILEIDFPDEETVYAGINIRPYIMECLEEARKHFQVIVFTASHQTYADAILDYIDPNNEYIEHRLYRQHCVLTEEGYYVKDMRIFGDRDLADIVIIDNSVYSFAFQIDNGIPIIPFYNDKADEEMLHLIYYLNCLAGFDDVRDQNRQAFELFKLQDGQNLDQGEEQQVEAQNQYQIESNDII